MGRPEKAVVQSVVFIPPHSVQTVKHVGIARWRSADVMLCKMNAVSGRVHDKIHPEPAAGIRSVPVGEQFVSFVFRAGRVRILENVCAGAVGKDDVVVARTVEFDLLKGRLFPADTVQAFRVADEKTMGRGKIECGIVHPVKAAVAQR